jgi:hypothetical protein
MSAAHPNNCVCDECLEGVLPAESAPPQPGPVVSGSLANEIREVAKTLAPIDPTDRLAEIETPEHDAALAADLAAIGETLDCGRQDDEPGCRLEPGEPCAACQQRDQEEHLTRDLGSLASELDDPSAPDEPLVPKRDEGRASDAVAGARDEVAAARDDLSDVIAELRALSEATKSLLDD